MADLAHAGKIRRVEGSHFLAGTLLGKSVSSIGKATHS